jgi:DNA-binding transcriptional ArsR family regulator
MKEGDYTAKANIFKVLSVKHRRDILVMLKDERLNAGEIAQKLGVSPAALSYHLKLLKEADLVMEYKEKNFIYYEINATVFQELVMWISQFKGE